MGEVPGVGLEDPKMPLPKYKNTVLELPGWIRNQKTLWDALDPAPKGARERALLKEVTAVTGGVTRLDAQWTAMPWDGWETKVDRTCRTSVDVQQVMGAVAAYDIRQFNGALDEIARAAQKGAKEAKKQGYGPLADYLGSMNKEAKKLKRSVERYVNTRLGFFNKVMRNLVMNEQIVAREVVSVLKSLPADAKTCMKEIGGLDEERKKLARYETFRTEVVRSLSASLGIYLDLMYPRDTRLGEIRKKFANLGSEAGRPTEAGEIQPMMVKVAEVHKALRKELKGKGMRL